MTGYVRQSAADIVPTGVVRAAPINNELNALRDAFATAGGHKHDGTAAEGHPVPVIGDSDLLNKIATDTGNNRHGVFVEVAGAAVEQVRFQDGAIVPVTDNDVDLGTSSLEFKDLHIDGTANIDSLVADTADINGGTVDGAVIGGSSAAAGSFTTIGATGAITSTVSTGTAPLVIASTTKVSNLNVDQLDGADWAAPAAIGTSTPAAGTFTSLTANTSLVAATADINGGTLDGAVIGASSAQAITGTTVTATTGFVGGLTGNVTGNTTGTHTGAVIGNVTGDVTGNVTASSGSSSFNDVVINGGLNMNAGTSATITNLTSPTNTNDAATKGYVDTSIANLIDSAPGALDTLNELAAALGDDASFSTTVTNSIATKLALAGGTMSGAIAMGTNKITGLGNPTANQDAATKTYVDTADALKLSLTGGTMSGAIAMGTSKITGLGDPTSNQDAATKIYVDGILGSATSAAASAAAAATSASNAATSASNASTSASNAATSASSASTSATNAAASYDAFDDRYLGSKTSAPSVDNDGNALLTGALYWNSTSSELYLWTGSAWTRSALSGSDYVAKSGDTMTGALTTTALTLSGGTANGVTYLNGSKVLTSGSALVFDGTNLSVGTTALSGGKFSTLADLTAVNGLVVRDSATTYANNDNYVLLQNSTGATVGGLTHPASASMGVWGNDDIRFLQGSTPSEQMRLTSTGLGIGTSSPTNKLTVDGNANITGNTTLGDASTDTVTVNGYMGVGAAASADSKLLIVGPAASGTNQYGLQVRASGASGATGSVRAVYGRADTEAASFTTSAAVSFWSADAIKGAGSTITNQHGVYINDQTQGTNNYGITSLVSSGTNKWNIYASGTAANYFAGNVGIGTNSPISGSGLTVADATYPAITIASLQNNSSWTQNQEYGKLAFYSSDSTGLGAGETAKISVIADTSSTTYPAGALAFFTSNRGVSTTITERMRLDSAGNLGLGVTPSAWYSFSKVVQAGQSGAIETRSNSNLFAISSNQYINAAGNYTYITTDLATRYYQTNGQHIWQTAASGTAGTAISFTQAMTLNASGELLLGTTSSATSTCSIQAKTSGYSIWSINDATLNYSQFYFGGTATSGFQFIRSDGRSGGWLAFGTQDTERARIDSSGNVGIGTTSPSSYGKLAVGSTGSIAILGSTGSAGTTGRGLTLYNSTSTDGNNFAAASFKAAFSSSTYSSGYGYFETVNSSGTLQERARIDSSGNLGLGVTPSAWSSFTGLQVGALGGLNLGGSVDDSFVGSNVYYNSNWYFARPTTATYASMYRQIGGQHRFYTSSATGTAGNAITWTQAMTLDASGNLGVGTTSPAYAVDVAAGTLRLGTGSGSGGTLYFSRSGQSDAARVACDSSSNLQFYTGGSERARISSAGGFSVGTTADPGAGAIYATGAITAFYSDARLKTVSGKIENALDKVAKLSGVYYTNNDVAKSFGYDSDEVQVGVLAQEVEAVMPEIVKAAPFDLDENNNSKSGEHYKTVQYEKLVPLLIEAINELQAKVKLLENK